MVSPARFEHVYGGIRLVIEIGPDGVTASAAPDVVLRPKERAILDRATAELVWRKQLILRAGYPENSDSRAIVQRLIELGYLEEVGRKVRRRSR